MITICSQLRIHALGESAANIHISNIGTIRNTLEDLAGTVYDYPEDETFHDGAEHGSDGHDGYDGRDGRDGRDSYGDLAWPSEGRWRPVAAVGGAVIAICAIGTAVILNSGDSATTKATVSPATPRTAITTPAAPRTTAPPSARPSPPRLTQLPPETVTTLPPSASAAPTRIPTAAPPPAVLPPSTSLDPRTVVYTVTGAKGMLDLVNVVYTDARGYPQTVFNVALPWTKAIVLNPGVQTQSVIATSFTGKLDCSIVNAQGRTVVASAKGSIMATCTR